MYDDRHRHQEGLKFLRVIDDIVPPEKQIHMIVVNDATHKHPRVERWLSRHPRFHMHFTPTSCSWLNMVACTSPKPSSSSLRNRPFQLSFNPSLKVDFQGSRVTSDGGLLLVRDWANAWG